MWPVPVRDRLDLCDVNGDTPLHLSVKANWPKMTQLFVQHAATILRNSEGHAPRGSPPGSRNP